MTQAVFVQEGCSIDYTPVSAVSAGDVVLIGDNYVAVAKRDIAANAKGALDVDGVFDGVKDSSDIEFGDPLYWDSDGDPVGGTAGTGAFSSDATKGPFAGWALEDAGPSATTVRLDLESRDSAVAVARSALVQDDAKPYNVSLTRLAVTGTGAALGTAAGTPSGAFGITVGTFGSASPKVVGEAASGNSKTDKARFQFALPGEYVAGQTVTLRVKARITGNVSTTQTIDAEVYKTDGAAGIGSDLCATAAQSLTTSFANKDFDVTATGLAPGDLLDVQLTGVADDTGGTANKLIEIGAVEFLLDVKG